MFVINMVISVLYVDLCAFSLHYSIFFFRVSLNVLVRTPETSRTPCWESLLYGIIVYLMRLFSEARRYESCLIALTEFNSGTIQKFPFAVNTMSSKNNNYFRQYRDTF